jgi:hypothetical protein
MGGKENVSLREVVCEHVLRMVLGRKTLGYSGLERLSRCLAFGLYGIIWGKRLDQSQKSNEWIRQYDHICE